jgi:hypothetical protein
MKTTLKTITFEFAEGYSVVYKTPSESPEYKYDISVFAGIEVIANWNASTRQVCVTHAKYMLEKSLVMDGSHDRNE